MKNLCKTFLLKIVNLYRIVAKKILKRLSKSNNLNLQCINFNNKKMKFIKYKFFSFSSSFSFTMHYLKILRDVNSSSNQGWLILEIFICLDTSIGTMIFVGIVKNIGANTRITLFDTHLYLCYIIIIIIREKCKLSSSTLNQQHLTPNIHFVNNLREQIYSV